MINSTYCCPLAACAKSTTCVRYASYVKAKAESEAFSILNDSMLHPTEDGCEHYLVPNKVRVAYGFTKLYKTMPVCNASRLSWCIHWGSDSTYYRTKRGDRPISPALQNEILEMVRKYGGNPHVGFDHYADETHYVKP